jgi:hypothetical protein
MHPDKLANSALLLSLSKKSLAFYSQATLITHRVGGETLKFGIIHETKT